ncbi:MAG: helix-turn-helix transcriptional regulator, partial [Chloroflexia bacterium]|nr:helix-turn-helix transcriptional regulator [Chloroflexia bacterium]
VTPGSIYNWERGVYEPKARQLRALAQAFGVPMEAIDLDAPKAGMKAGGEAA